MIPNLTAKPFWDTSLFSWIEMLELNHPVITKEFLNLKNLGNTFQVTRMIISIFFQIYLCLVLAI
jgi:hypothetical protein